MIPESLSSIAVTETARQELYVDDDWLEAVLDNLALAQLSRADCVDLIQHLEELERSEQQGTPARLGVSARIAGGEHFESEFNAYGMRSPGAMTRENVLDTIVRAVRCLGLQGHAAAVRQIVFFISSNMDEVLVETEDDELSQTIPCVRFDV